MQATMTLDVPRGYTLEEFIDKVNAYVARLQRNAKRHQNVIMTQMKKQRRQCEKVKLMFWHISVVRSGQGREQ